MDEIDIWRTAKILVDAHGDGAPAQAIMRADHALDEETQNLWKRIEKAIRELNRTNPAPSEPRH